MRNPPTRVKPIVIAALFAALPALWAAAGCERKSAATPGETANVVRAIDTSEQDRENASKPIQPITGVDTSKLDDAKKERFHTLAERLRSPCGKAHSLRKSLEEDKSCKAAPYAARIVVSMLADEADDTDINLVYEDHYKDAEPLRFNVAGTPHKGPEDAPVKIVEFLDYGCGICKRMAPILENARSRYPNEVVVYFKMFPLPGHPDSDEAAQAALAAQAQGQFERMHDMLFARAPAHTPSDLAKYAREIGLDMDRFLKDYEAAAERVKADMAEGDKAGIEGTPAIYINGRLYSGPHHPDYVKMWIEEELAVNR